MEKSTSEYVYYVGLHTFRPKGKYRSFVFIDADQAHDFYETTKTQPNVMDSFICRDHITQACSYDGIMKPQKAELMDSYKRYSS